MITEAHLQGLEKALEAGGGSHSIEHVLAAVRRGEAQLWIADEKTCIVTEVIDAPNQKELHFWLTGGELEAAITLMEQVLDWGRERGCTVATMTGRKGWAKVLKDEGWTHHMVQMGRKL